MRILKKQLKLLTVLAITFSFIQCQGQTKTNSKMNTTQKDTASLPMPSGIENPNRVYFVTFLWYNEDGANQLNQFMDEAQPYWDKYKLGNVGVIQIGMKRAIEGENDIEQPDEIRLNYADDMSLFEQYTQDEEIQKIDHIRDGAIRRLTLVLGKEEDIASMKTSFESNIKDRLYVVQLLHFKEEGAEKWSKFNEAAAPLFKEYGLHFDYVLSPIKKVDGKGDGSDMQMPDKVVVFHADDPSRLADYNADERYLKLAPLRAEGVEHNKLFGGKLIAY
ncbi:hypothetical protein [Aquimarina sp. 2304DJ70-9]|uniref:hypothetical protein n=1 Tax=Aquimarina penaris TaxID=3231044 RepID=UPI0034618565